MKVVSRIEELTSIITSLKSSKKTIGLVPTMGALHQGHLSLIEKSDSENSFSIVTIFVNPTQFDKKEDLINYPSTLKEDLILLEKSGCDLVFTPNASEIYENNISPEVFTFEGLEHEMEGKHRNNHFDGVGTIVKKFFKITKPDNAYFGEKDFQQLQIIRKMVSQEKMPLNVIGCPIFREDDGLAMSSRNIRLNKSERQAVPFIFKTLKQAATKFSTQTIAEIKTWTEIQFNNHPALGLEYFEIADEATLQAATKKQGDTKYRAFIAVYVNSIRLIDNISL
tara:strand:- start:20467 stop:21309 length:843 start_codon:yes stop_codon:yes gene_type:complete